MTIQSEESFYKIKYALVALAHMTFDLLKKDFKRDGL